MEAQRFMDVRDLTINDNCTGTVAAMNRRASRRAASTEYRTAPRSGARTGAVSDRTAAMGCSVRRMRSDAIGPAERIARSLARPGRLE